MSSRHRTPRGDRPRPYRDARGPAPGTTSAPSARTPLLLRATLVTAVVMAIAASLVRSHTGSIAADRAFASASATVDVAASQAHSSTSRAPRSSPAARSRQSASGASCRVTSAVTSRSGDNNTTVLTVVNSGSTPVHGWTLRWPIPAGQQITNGWNATVTSDGRFAAASDAGLNRDIPVGGSTTIGFVTMSGAPVTAGFTLNGVKCR